MTQKCICINSLLHRCIASVFLFSIGFSISAFGKSQSINEYQKTVRQLDAQSDYFYVSFNEPFALNCAYGIAYISSANKGLYVQLLAAKLAGKRISRLVYSQPGGSGSSCNVELVEISD